MIESLFIVNAPKPSSNDTRWQVLPSAQDNGDRVLDPKKAQNIAILLRALNVTVEEVCEGLLEGIVSGLSRLGDAFLGNQLVLHWKLYAIIAYAHVVFLLVVAIL